jgi:N-acetylmuramoyl-L-alanine amidase
MKKFAFALTAALLPLLCARTRAAESLAVVFAGKPLDPVPSYRAEGQLYLDVQRVGAIYGGEVYWSPVSGRVRLTLRGRSMRFAVDSAEAESGGEKFALGAPLRVRASRAFLPLQFLRSDAFARWSGYDAHTDGNGTTLMIERRATVGPVHAFTFKNRTRVVLELAPGVDFRTEARGVGVIEVTIPYSIVEEDDSVAVDDGIVAVYAVHQEASGARVTVKLASPGERWRATELSSPHRLALDVYAPGITPPATVPPDAPPPPAAPVARAAAAPAAPAAVKARRRVIVIDAGHGGKDPGATGTRGTQEKTITLATALELGRVLRERGDFDVVLTRTDDTFVALSDRSKTANDLDADLFVSLHCNSTKNHRERGFEVYSVSETASDPEAQALAAAENAPLALEDKKPEDESAQQILLAMTKTEMVNESAPFAALVERELAKRLDVPDRGLKQAAFYVLRGTHAPAILVEMAYLSQPTDELELGTKRFRRKVVAGVAAGVADYAKKKGWLH